MFVEGILAKAHERLVTIAEKAQLIEAVKLLRVSDLVVVCNDDGVMVGVITKTDAIVQISQCPEDQCTGAISSMMNRDVVQCRPRDWLHDVWPKMKERGLKNIPITDHEVRPIGVLNARDALQALLQEAEDEEALLRDYVMGIGYQ